MSKDKFVFEWRAGDKYKAQGSETVWTSVHPEDLRGHLYKPYGKTKKRYKAEKTAWKQSQKAEKLAQQQSRMKVGDWVKDIVSGQKYQLEVVAKRSGAFGHEEMPCLKNLKPCKPPKPEKPVLESENFRIEDGRLIFTGSEDGDADWGAIRANGSLGHCYVPQPVDKNSKGTCGYTDSESLREIATLLDRSTAAKK